MCTGEEGDCDQLVLQGWGMGYMDPMVIWGEGMEAQKNNWFLFRLTDPWLWRKKEFRPETERCLANPKSAKRSMTTLKTFPRAAPLTPPPSPDTCPPSATFHLSVTPATCWPHRHRCILHPASPSDLTTLPAWSLPWVSKRTPLLNAYGLKMRFTLYTTCIFAGVWLWVWRPESNGRGKKIRI